MNSRKITLSLLIMFVSLLPLSLSASDISLNASVSPEKGTVGSPFTYTLSIEGIEPEKLKVTLPEKRTVFPEKKAKGNEQKDSAPAEEFVPLYTINSAERSDADDGKIIRINISITYYRTGNYTLPEVGISGADGVKIGYKIPAVTIDETNSEGAFEEIEPPVALSGSYYRLLILAAILVLLTVASVLIWKRFKNRKKPSEPEEELHPIEIFLDEMGKLNAEELIRNGQINDYTFGISIIFRRYLSSMFGFDAAEMTTDEIESKIKRYMPQELYLICGDDIIRNMRLWDFSKFAEFTPSEEMLLRNLEESVVYAKRISGIERGDDGTVRV